MLNLHRGRCCCSCGPNRRTVAAAMPAYQTLAVAGPAQSIQVSGSNHPRPDGAVAARHLRQCNCGAPEQCVQRRRAMGLSCSA